MKAPTQKVVTVRWADAVGTDGRETMTTKRAKKLRLHDRYTTGFLVAVRSDAVVIAQDWNAATGEWEGVTAIPQPWIKEDAWTSS